MTRIPSLEEARDNKIAELTKKKLDYTKALIASGDMTTIREVGECVTDYLAFAYDDLNKLVMGAITFDQVRDKVMEVDAESEAIKQVEKMEARRLEESMAARAERWLWNSGVLV